ncbi:MAG TPA: hypothetical protein VHE61_18245 [Opitutaceae bacterium]|nr:hypothetical protein [Opitutaceae bacterium]
MLARLSRFRAAALVVCLFVFVVGANWATFEKFGSDMPDWDQWDAEGIYLLAPWFEHDHFVAHLFHPHNEHRVILTKLQNLAVVLASGQWDARLECLFNALLHAAIAIAFWLIARRLVNARWQPLYYLVVAILYGLPLAWQNLLGGFHNQQYWLIGLSFAAIVLLPFARAWSAAWFAGAIAAILALGSMGSGFLAAAAVFGVVVWRWLQRQTTLRAELPTLLLTAILITIGDATRVEVYYHQVLKAKTVHDFTLYLLRSLEWPLRDHDWAGVLLWFPFLILVWYFIRSGACRRSRAMQTLLALNGWVLLQLVATAVERGAGADYPASRYMDTLIFGTAVNGLGLGWMLSGFGRRSSDSGRTDAVAEAGDPASRSGQRFAGRMVIYVSGIAWLIPLAIGLDQLTIRNVEAELPATKNYYVNAESHLRGYLATNDPAELSDPIPYPSADALRERLGHPAIRRLMPECVRPALPLAAAPGIVTSFERNSCTQRQVSTAPRTGLSPETPPLASRPTWGSFNDRGLANTGTWQSAPLVAPMQGWLRIETAGDVGEPGASLELEDAATHAVLAHVEPTKLPHNSWRSAYVRSPRRPFIFVARDSDPSRWLAFSAPVEISLFSYWGWQVLKQGLVIAEVSGSLALLLWLAGIVIDPRRPVSAPTGQRLSAATGAAPEPPRRK